MWSIQKKLFVIFLTFLLLLLISIGVSNFNAPIITTIPVFDISQNTEHEYQGNDKQLVKKVIDGDTFELENGIKVRMIGIDTPEVYNFGDPKECFADEASKYTKELIEGKIVILKKDISETDKYGRLLRYVYLDNIFINEELVKNGYAFSKAYQPDTSFQELFTTAEKNARLNQIGLWRSCPN